MRNIKKELKKSAKQVLPNESVKNNIKLQLGINTQEVTVQNNGTAVKSFSNNKMRNTLIAVIVIFCMLIITALSVVVVRGGKQLPISNSLINLDMCASVQIIADKDDIVSTVEPLDKDGVLLMYGMADLTGKGLVEVCDLLANESQKLGFLTETQTVEVIAINDNYDKEKVLTDTLISELEKKGLTVSTPQSNISKFIANLRMTTPNKVALLESVAMKLGQNTNEINNYDIVQLSKMSKNYSQSKIDSATSKIENAMSSNELINIKNKLKELEKCLDDIEDLQDDVSDNEFNAQKYIDKFNTAYPQYAYTLPYDEDSFEKHFDNIAEQLEEELDDLEDEFEDYYDSIKKQLKQDFDKDDDDDDDDDDD